MSHVSLFTLGPCRHSKSTINRSYLWQVSRFVSDFSSPNLSYAAIIKCSELHDLQGKPKLFVSWCCRLVSSKSFISFWAIWCSRTSYVEVDGQENIHERKSPELTFITSCSSNSNCCSQIMTSAQPAAVCLTPQCCCTVKLLAHTHEHEFCIWSDVY